MKRFDRYTASGLVVLICILAFIAIMLASPMPAHATGTPTPTPSPTTSTSASSAGSSSTSGAKAAADAIAGANGTGTGTGTGTGGAASLEDHSSARMYGFVLPTPVWTPPMPRPDVPVMCPAPTETQGSVAVGSGLIFSKADSLRDNDPCTAIKYSALLWDRCQYAKADKALNIGLKLFAKKAGENWDMKSDANLTDYSAKECAVLRAPPLPPAPVTNYVSNYSLAAPATAASAPSCPVPKKRPATTVVKAVGACK